MHIVLQVFCNIYFIVIDDYEENVGMVQAPEER